MNRTPVKVLLATVALATALAGCGDRAQGSSSYTPVKEAAPAAPAETAGTQPGVLVIPFEGGRETEVRFACAGPDMVYTTNFHDNLSVVPNHPDCAS